MSALILFLLMAVGPGCLVGAIAGSRLGWLPLVASTVAIVVVAIVWIVMQSRECRVSYGCSESTLLFVMVYALGNAAGFIVSATLWRFVARKRRAKTVASHMPGR
jgi:membrane associated rhomboid family serine protease